METCILMMLIHMLTWNAVVPVSRGWRQQQLQMQNLICSDAGLPYPDCGPKQLPFKQLVGNSIPSFLQLGLRTDGELSGCRLCFELSILLCSIPWVFEAGNAGRCTINFQLTSAWLDDGVLMCRSSLKVWKAQCRQMQNSRVDGMTHNSPLSWGPGLLLVCMLVGDCLKLSTGNRSDQFPPFTSFSFL